MTGPASASSSSAPVRYAVRQVLDQEYRKEKTRKLSEGLGSSRAGKGAKQPSADGPDSKGRAADKKSLEELLVKRDFFGRIIKEPTPPPDSGQNQAQNEASKAGRKAWVTYHDGFSNAVRKPISMGELLADF